MDVVQKTLENKNNTKSIIKYSLVLFVFIGAFECTIILDTFSLFIRI